MRIVTLGELMIRFSPPLNQRFLQAAAFNISFADSEANVAVDLACLGMKVAFVSAVPAHEIGQMAVNSMQMFGVDTSGVIRNGNRLGVLYLEKGAAQRPTKVIYDRKASSFACSSVSSYDFEKLFSEASWFHFSGITPALSNSAAEICELACQVANECGLTISCDINYRSKLWTRQEARKTMRKLMKYVDICMANEGDCADVFGISAINADVAGGNLDRSGYIEVARQMATEFDLKSVAITLRESRSADENGWSGLLYTSDKAYFSRKYDIHIVDRVGTGDSFAAGIIYAMQNEYGNQETIDFAAALSCLKHTVEGDYSLISIDEVIKLVEGNMSGRVLR